MTVDYNPGEELVSCLDVLWEELQERVTYGEGLGEDECEPDAGIELNTALWQVPQLVIELLQELNTLYDLIDGYQQARAVEAAPKASGLVLPDGTPV